jgi:hypothetical protein
MQLWILGILINNMNKSHCNSRSEGGDTTEQQLCEPGGLAVSADGTLLYIADTNNHCIRHCCQLAESSASQLGIGRNKVNVIGRSNIFIKFFCWIFLKGPKRSRTDIGVQKLFFIYFQIRLQAVGLLTWVTWWLISKTNKLILLDSLLQEVEDFAPTLCFR